ncbi:MAG: GrpB family protein [Vallitaleaceae bacterium]|jgi:GrpB-like predicted nucleotidyltransferase (UPF0157 family)|nr:GrpB family protein [Vallitaleaceae bacterium]
MKEIQVVEYNPNWKFEFEKAKAFYDELLQGVKAEVVHVGSTSIEGLWAKPILDIDIIVNNQQDTKKVIVLLESVGYMHAGNLGIEGREAFKYTIDNEYINWMEHHLYLCLRGHESLQNHLLLQRHLRKNKKAVEAYSQLKRELAKEYANDMDSYIDKKTDMITRFLKEEGMEDDSLTNIKEANKIN